ncbi:MAG: ABC transporter permease [Chloroflexia bacterium]
MNRRRYSSLAFPTIVLLLFGSIYGGYPIPGTNLRGVDVSSPAYTGMIIATVGLIGLPVTIAAYRETGVLRRLRATPLHPFTFLGAEVFVNLLMTGLGIALLLSARLVFDIRSPQAPLSVLLALVLSCVSFFAVGFALGGLLPTVRVALAVGQASFFPMLFLSGAAIPRSELPDTFYRVSEFLPLTYVVLLIQDLWIDGTWNLSAAAVVIGVLVAAGVVSSLTFRWE